jgi:hypothetical protein
MIYTLGYTIEAEKDIESLKKSGDQTTILKLRHGWWNCVLACSPLPVRCISHLENQFAAIHNFFVADPCPVEWLPVQGS